VKFRYMPMTEENRQEMLKVLGIESTEELFSDIPNKVRFKGELQVSSALSELETQKYFSRLAGKNASFDQYSNFLGAGIYEHYIPSVVNHVISRSEFYTAYTPYQPEISQGELQAIFEFQTYIAELTGMGMANSSMYDGPTSLAEAGTMAAGATKRNKIVVSRAVHPESRAILLSYARGLDLEVVEVGLNDGLTDLDALRGAVDDQTAAVIVQYPNFFGGIEDLTSIETIAHDTGSLFIVSANPLSLGLLKPPGEFGADIVVGEAQPLGISASFGGPTCGYFATTEKLMRRMPGRVVGQTVDEDGKRGFVLTLQAREQHIRREKATSNICSNQALLALAAATYVTAMGKQGMQDVARLNVQKAHYAQEKLAAAGFSPAFTSPFFNEFAIKLQGNVGEINSRLLGQGIIGGYDLGREYPEFAGYMLVAVTEAKTKEEIDQFVEVLGGIAR
jgi:glycine dehydrogenase subunit 1